MVSLAGFLKLIEDEIKNNLDTLNDSILIMRVNFVYTIRMILMKKEILII